ncbi:hypothetical protein DFH09DRAFT_1353814, partial [Mycena vulgaris]
MAMATEQWHPHPHHHAPMTPPHTAAVGHRTLDWHHQHWASTSTSHLPPPPPNSHSNSYAQAGLGVAQGRHGQLLTPPDDTPAPMHGHGHGQYAPPANPPPPHASSSHSHSPSHSNSHPHPHTPPPPPRAPSPPARPEAHAEEQAEDEEQAPLAWAHDWLHVSRARPESAARVAEKTCEMICYLWFAPGPSAERERERGGERERLQLTASPTFVAFTQKLLETTQVSQSVIVLALHYIHRLRARNGGVPAQPGSEFRVAVAGAHDGEQVFGRQHIHKRHLGRRLAHPPRADKHDGARVPRRLCLQPLSSRRGCMRTG